MGAIASYTLARQHVLYKGCQSTKTTKKKKKKKKKQKIFKKKKWFKTKKFENEKQLIKKNF